MPKHEAMGRRLQAALGHAGITQLELAAKVGVSQSYIARMVAGDRGGDGQLHKIADILGIPERWLRAGAADAMPEWARLSPELTGRPPTADKPRRGRDSGQRSTRELLEAILAEQQAMRQALDLLAHGYGEHAPRRRADPPRRVAEPDAVQAAATRPGPTP